MSKLLHAGFIRMFKSRTLLICLAILGFTNGISLVINYIQGSKTDLPDSFLLSGLILVSIMAAVVVSSYLGAEHRFGTIRNKLIIGHSRGSVYASSFLVCLAGVLTMFALVWILTIVLGNLLLGGFAQSNAVLCMLLLRSFLAITVLTALYTALALCIQSKSKGSVAAVIIAFVLMLTAVAVVQMLSEPAYLPAESVVSTEEIQYEPVPDDPSLVINPYYVGGTKRMVYQVIHDLCPVTQMIQESDALTGNMILIPVAEIVILLAAGMVIFKKRDLK